MQKQGSSIRDHSSSEIVTSDLIDILLTVTGTRDSDWLTTFCRNFIKQEGRVSQIFILCFRVLYTLSLSFLFMHYPTFDNQFHCHVPQATQ